MRTNTKTRIVSINSSCEHDKHTQVVFSSLSDCSLSLRRFLWPLSPDVFVIASFAIRAGIVFVSPHWSFLTDPTQFLFFRYETLTQLSWGEKSRSPMSCSCRNTSDSSSPHASEHTRNMTSWPACFAEESAVGTIAHTVLPVVNLTAMISPS